MAIQAGEIKERVAKFLETARDFSDSVLIYARQDVKNVVINEVRRFYNDRKIRVIDSSMTDKDQIDKTFSTSLKEGGILIIHLEKGLPTAVTRHIEQIKEDGYIPVNVGGNTLRVEPVESWQAIIWVNQDNPHDDEKVLRRLFVHKLVVTA